MRRSIKYLLAALLMALLLCFAAQAESTVTLERVSEATTGVDVTYKITAPAEATNCVVYFAYDGEYSQWSRMNVELTEGVGTFTQLYYYEYTEQMKAAVVIDGQTVESNELIVEIPSLGEPGTELVLTGPDTAAADQGYTFSWNAIPEATSYTVRIGGLAGWRSFEAEQATSYTIPADVIAQYPQARVGVYAFCKGYDTLWAVKNISVSSYAYADGITVTAPAEVYQGKQFSIGISAPGAGSIQYAFLGAGYGNRSGEAGNFSLSMTYAPGTYNLYARAMYNGKWSAFSAPVPVLLKEAALVDPGLTVPEQLPLGQPLTLAYTNASHVNAISLSVYDADENWMGGYNYDITEASGSVELAENLFIDPGRYSLWISFEMEDGYRADNLNPYFTAVGSRDPGPVVTAAKSAVNVGEDALFTVTDDTATRYTYKMWVEDLNGGYLYNYSPSTSDMYDGMGQRGFYADEGDVVYCFKASVLRGGKWSAYSDTVRVRINSALGTLKQPDITLVTPIAAGACPQVTFGQVDNAQRYCVNIAPQEENGRWDYFRFDAPGTYTLETVLDAGTYEMRFWVEADGWNRPDDVERWLTVEGALREGPAVNADPQTVQAGQSVTVTAEMENAERFMFVRRVYNADGTFYTNYNNYTVDAVNGSVTTSFGVGTSFGGKTMEVQARALVNGVWTALGVPAVISIEEADPVPMPHVTMPTSLTVEQDLVITFDSVEGADYYSFSINETDGFYRNYYMEEGGTITVPAGMLDAGSYTLNLHVRMNDGRYGNLGRSFVVTGEQEEGPRVVLPEEAAAMTDIPYTISFPGAEQFAIEFKTSWINEYGNNANSSDYETMDAEDGAVDLSYYFWQENGGTLYARAKALVNGVWTAYGEVASVSVGTAQELERAVIHMEETADLTQPVIVTFDPVPNAGHYYFELVTPDGEMLRRFYLDAPEEVTLPLDEMDEGTYTITVRAQGAGYKASESTRYLTITESRPEAPTVSWEARDAYYVNEDIVFTVNTAGAQALQFRPMEYYEPQDIPVEGDSTQFTYHFYWGMDTGDLQFRAYDGTTWSKWSDSLHLLVEYHKLSAPVISVPETLQIGDDLIITIESADEHVTYYYVEISNPDDTGSSWWVDRTASAYTVSQNYFDPGVYRVRLYACGEDGWEGVYSLEHTVTVEGDRLARPKVTYDTDRTYYVGDTVVFTVTAPGADAAEYKLRSSDEEPKPLMLTDGVGTFEGTIETYYENIAVTARVSKDGEWSMWSNPVEVYPSSRPCPEPVVETSSAEYTVGQDVTLTLTRASDMVAYFGVNVWRADTGDHVYGGSYPISDTDSIEAVLDDSIFEAGQYRLEIYAYGDWSQGVSNSPSVSVNVTFTGERVPAPEVSYEQRTYYKNETVTFTVSAPGAEQVVYRLYSYDDAGYEATLTDGTAEITYTFSEINEGIYFSCRALTSAGWSRWSDPVYISCQYRPMPTPAVEADKTDLQLGENVGLLIQRPSEDVTGYNVAIINQDTNEHVTSFGYGAWEEWTHVELDEGYFEAGSYRIEVSSQGNYAEGWENSEPMNVYITYTGQRQPCPQVTLPKASVFNDGQMTVVISGVGVTDVMCAYVEPYYTSTSYYSTNENGRFDAWVYMNEMGDHILKLRVKIDGVWSDYSEPITYTLKSRSVFQTPDAILPADLKRIEREAFAYTPFEVVRIPNGVTTIEADAFLGCRNLAQVYIPASVTTIDSAAFDSGYFYHLTVFGKAGSEAQTYANDKGITFIAYEP